MCVRAYGIQSGIARRINSPNNGTVNARYPCDGLYIMPLLIRFARAGPTLVIGNPREDATSLVRFP